ncbi:MAG: response regulator [Alphaproteobacteria bacterium]|nr:response regulator [Alphaproteobacteria bacterium]
MKTCLVVDDSKVVRKVAYKMLESLSFKVLEAENGKEALAQFKQHKPEVVLLDWNMPVMDGLEFIKALRALDASEGKQPIVIFCTTENDIGKIQAAIAAGADEYIMKPFDLEIIRAKLMQVGLI